MDKGTIVFYIGGDRLHSGQYVELVRNFQAKGLNAHLIVRNAVSHKELLPNLLSGASEQMIGPNRVSDFQRELDGKFHVVTSVRGGDFVFRRRLGETILKNAVGYDRVIVHIKQITSYAPYIKRILGDRGRVLAEFEGDYESEIVYASEKRQQPLTSKDSYRISNLRRQEAKTIKNVDVAVVVTENLKRLLCKRHPEVSEDTDQFHIFPTLASQEKFSYQPKMRDKIRIELGISDRKVITYCGNLNCAWQLPDKLGRAFQIIYSQDPKAFFLVVTQDRDQRYLRPYLEGLPSDSYMFRQVPHHEIRNYYSAADVGLLLRDNHVMNQVATPSKFAEYVMCGLSIIMTSGIGDYSKIMKDHGNVLMLDNLDFAQEDQGKIQEFVAKSMSSEERETFGEWATERFSIQNRIPDLIKLYDRLAYDTQIEHVGTHQESRP